MDRTLGVRPLRDARRCHQSGKLAAYGFFREENIILEARSILNAFRFAESRYPRRHLLILSGNLALVLALSLCKGLPNIHIALSHASNLCVWYQGRICLIVQVDTVGVELLLQGKSFL